LRRATKAEYGFKMINVIEGGVCELVGFLLKRNLKYFLKVLDGLNELLGRSVLKKFLDLSDRLLE